MTPFLDDTSRVSVYLYTSRVYTSRVSVRLYAKKSGSLCGPFLIKMFHYLFSVDDNSNIPLRTANEIVRISFLYLLLCPLE